MRLILASSLLAASTLAVASTPAAADPMADAKAIIDAHRAMPVFVAPGESFDAKACMADKKVLSIPISMTIPFNVELQKAMASAAAGVLNCLWEQELDGRMQRTSRRALPSGRLAQRQAFQADQGAREAFLRSIGVQPLAGARLISLFAYENAGLAGWLDALAAECVAFLVQHHAVEQTAHLPLLFVFLHGALLLVSGYHAWLVSLIFLTAAPLMAVTIGIFKRARFIISGL